MADTGKLRLLVSCGEPSGDLYAAELVRNLRLISGPVEVFGLGGDRLEEQGSQLVAHVRDLAVIGLVEVLRHLKRLRRVFRSVLAEADARRPDLALLVDYPDFNLRLARELKARGIPVVYYVSPQLWAWRRGRMRTIRDTVAHMIVIFPFELELYRQAAVPVTFVGHPLVELVQPESDRAGFLTRLGLDPERPLVAALPGSRRQEVGHNLPPLAAALRLLHARRPEIQSALAIAPSLEPSAFDAPLAGLPTARCVGQAHALMSCADAGIVASGTATVEAALLGMPFAVVYRLSSLTYALGRPLVSVRHYAMANLIAGREVVKELIQKDFTDENVAGEILRLLENPARRSEVIQGLSEIRDELGGKGASERAAHAVLRTLLRSRKA